MPHAKGGVAPHLWDLLSRSSVCLDHRQTVHLAALLHSYADVFLVGDLDLGHTALVKHHKHQQQSAHQAEAMENRLHRATGNGAGGGRVSESLVVRCGPGQKKGWHNELLC